MVNRSETSDDARQALSALMDGELASDSVAGACARWRQDAEARGRWHAYHLIGDVLRSEDLATPPARDEAFLQALRLRLADEPVPLAPAPLLQPAAALTDAPARGTASRAAPARAGGSRRWLMAPASVAAGFMAVAGVMVVTRVMAPEPAAGPVVAGVSVVAPAASATLVRDPRLDRYLSAHRSLAHGVATAGGAEHRVHIVFEGQ